MKLLETVVFVLGACFPQMSTSQGLETLPIGVQPLVYDRDNAVYGCGLRVTGGEAAATGPSSWFDISVNLFRRGIGIAQSIAYEIRPSGYDGESRPARVPVQSTWIKAEAASARMGENSERHDTLVYRLVVDDVLSLFETIANRQPITLGIKRWGQREDAVYSGTPMLTAESRERIAGCLEQLAIDLQQQ